MRILLLLSFIFPISFHSIAQKINYTIPEGFENQISKPDYKRIADFAVKVVAKKYEIERLELGTIYLKENQDLEAINLHNLISRCLSVADKAQWNEIIQGHMENIFSSIEEQKNMEPENYEKMKKYLGLRIYPNELIEMRGGASTLITKSDLEGTTTILMLDLPGAFTAVDTELFSLWAKDTLEVFRTAQENVNKQQIEKVTENFEVDGSRIEVIFLGNEDYAASYALDLMNNSPDVVGEWGSAIAIPNKGLVDICKISKDKPLDFVKFIQLTKPLIEKSYLEHEQPVSNHFFWYYRGTFTPIRIVSQPDGNINVISPMGLAALMTKDN